MPASVNKIKKEKFMDRPAEPIHAYIIRLCMPPLVGTAGRWCRSPDPRPAAFGGQICLVVARSTARGRLPTGSAVGGLYPARSTPRTEERRGAGAARLWEKREE
jgi:hypothetical protein